jgi:hypothetical protein
MSIGNSYTSSSQLVYRRVTTIIERRKSKEWSMLDEDDYEKIDPDISRYPC